MRRIIPFLPVLLAIACQMPAISTGGGFLTLQIVRTAGEEVLWQSPVKPGDRFTIAYRHSSDHTPVLDLFEVNGAGEIVLIEESYLWYGAGLESHPGMGQIDFSDRWTRVRMRRIFPRFLLRVGEIANPVLTLHGSGIRMLSIAGGGESIWIRVTRNGKIR